MHETFFHHRIKLRPPNPRLRLGKYPTGFPILDHVFQVSQA